MTDPFVLDGLESYWLAILVFHHTGEYWSRAPLMSDATDAVPAHGLAFADGLGVADTSACGEARILVDVEYM